jgi:DNA adenine methylase
MTKGKQEVLLTVPSPELAGAPAPSENVGVGKASPVSKKIKKAKPPVFRPLRPYLKWPGAKTRLIGELSKDVPPSGRVLLEPFAGTGSVALNLIDRFDSAILSDINVDLIECHKRVVSATDAFIDEVKDLFIKKNRSVEAYNKLRAEFNLCKDVNRRSSLFVYLNRHCFNGLCRYSATGKFNTPCGHYEEPYLPEAEMRLFAERMKTVSFVTQDFRSLIALAGPRDLLYCDPPYAPLTATSNFTAYASGGFSLKDQTDLAKLAGEAAARGATAILSNHDTDFTRAAYVSATAIRGIAVSRSISASGASRKKAAEVIAVWLPGQN